MLLPEVAGLHALEEIDLTAVCHFFILFVELLKLLAVGFREVYCLVR